MKRDANATLEFGYVSRAHGLDGEVVVRTHDPASDVLDHVERVHVKPRAGDTRVLDIEDVAMAPGGDLRVKFVDVNGRAQAQALVGSTLSVFREDLEEPAEGEFFQGDLVGLTAVSPSGERLGEIFQVWNTGPVPNLVIRDGEKEILVPFAEEFVPKVDLEARRVTVIAPEMLE